MFLFLTRTRDKDYRVYQNSGELAGIGAEKIFMDILSFSGITGTEAPFAVLNEKDEKFYVLAGGMKTESKDREGRPIRFSFCCGFDEREDAFRTFLTLASKWNEAVEFMRSYLEEKRGEIKFSHIEFLNRLKSSEPEGLKINLQTHNPPPKSSLSKIFFGLALLVVLLVTGSLIFYSLNLKDKLALSQNKIASLTTKIDGLKEIHSGLSRTLEVMGNSYRFMSMSSEDVKLAVEYSRSEAEKAKILLDEVSAKIAGFKIEE